MPQYTFPDSHPKPTDNGFTHIVYIHSAGVIPGTDTIVPAGRDRISYGMARCMSLTQAGHNVLIIAGGEIGTRKSGAANQGAAMARAIFPLAPNVQAFCLPAEACLTAINERFPGIPVSMVADKPHADSYKEMAFFISHALGKRLTMVEVPLEGTDYGTAYSPRYVRSYVAARYIRLTLKAIRRLRLRRLPILMGKVLWHGTKAALMNSNPFYLLLFMADRSLNKEATTGTQKRLIAFIKRWLPADLRGEAT